VEPLVIRHLDRASNEGQSQEKSHQSRLPLNLAVFYPRRMAEKKARCPL
jgi:hypothetical protein